MRADSAAAADSRSFEHPHECATRQVRGGVLFQHERQTGAIDRGPDDQLHIVNDQGPVNGNRE